MHCHHDILVETEAELLREAKCRNVYTEPALLPTSEQLHPKGTITADGARLDVVAIGAGGSVAQSCDRLAPFVGSRVRFLVAVLQPRGERL